MDPTGAAPLRPTDRREIGPYRLLGRLGEGGMGTVFLARAPTERLVAVKVVKAEYANQQGFAARFHAEVENARRVASFCTAEVLDNGNSDDGRPYMVTEFIAGTPLSEQIAQYGQLDPGTLHGVALGVAAALAAIHNAGLVHRDLKPANVILSLSGPRVIDFGIARALDRDSGFTLSGELLGSPGWWAPEQVRGIEITPAADIFSWGCLVAYAGNGRHPFGRGDVITLASRVLNNQPDLGALPAPLNDLVRQATEMDPGARPSAQELVLALVGGAPRPVDPPTVIATNVLNQSWQPPENVVKDTGAFRRFSRRGRKKAEQEALEREFQEAVGAVGVAGAAGQTPPPRDAVSRVDDPTPAPIADLRDAASAPTYVRPEPDHTNPAEPASKPRSTRWLIAAAAAVAALSVTGAVLISTLRPVSSTSTQTDPTAGPTQVTQQVNDVGRRFALGPAIDDPQLLVTEAPQCGLADYQGTRSTQGQLCIVKWTMINPGGTIKELGDPVVTLTDNQGAAHDPAPADLPASVVPGGRVDGVFVFDLAPLRTPAKLSATMFPGGKQVEVIL
ncbi:serine/threonine-protein kinase [Nonomuraea sp. NPDC050663]|uniref:serine/threonine-protein kinase n=1 Tax=Nonomuraea sp. NPDC050663 TaxID=3364370 RepID=UPI0037919CE1